MAKEVSKDEANDIDISERKASHDEVNEVGASDSAACEL